ncbi:MAG: hypothetical protein JWM85_1197 [Acidimicrobiaceae bacterium]|nr:hypothetical protein [Acidimicrobiaceae bacterium]
MAERGRLRAHLGLGSNLGDRWALLGGAVSSLGELDADLVVSPIYESAPVGGPALQPPYLNAVVRLVVERSPLEVLELAGRLEQAAGRVREERWGPRTLDVDVLLLDEEDGGSWRPLELDLPELSVPHPRLYERAFVLAPLEDCSPDLVPAGWRQALGGAEALESALRRVGEIVRVAAP